MFQAIGALRRGVLSLAGQRVRSRSRPTSAGSAWPFPLPLLGAALAGALLAVPVGLIAMRRLRGDYQAMAMLVLSLIANGLIERRDRAGSTARPGSS